MRHHDVDARIKKVSKAFGALRDHFFSTRNVSERLKGKIYTGGVLAVLLYGCESWCLTAESISRLRICIRQALKKRREHGQESWVLFVDLVKAFDSVPRDVHLAGRCPWRSIRASGLN